MSNSHEAPPGALRKELEDALHGAFPTYDGLQQMVQYELGESLERLVGRGALQSVVFDLVTWAVAQGKLRALVEAACRTVPHNARLREVAARITGDCRDERAAPSERPVPDAGTAHEAGGPAFEYGRPIERDQDFVGREEERRRILDALAQGQPVELLGEARMGRTSLLAWTERHAGGARPVVRVAATRGMTAVGLVSAIAAARGIDVRWSRRPTEREALDALRSMLPMTLLVDDANLLVEHGEACSGSFFSTLRLHGQRGELAREMNEAPEVPPVFVAGLALSPERPDETSLFKGRRDISREIEHDLTPDRRGVLVIQGQRRMGKSSLARWLPRLLGTGTSVVTVDFQGLSGHPLRAAPHRIVLDAIARTPGLDLPSPPPESERWSEALTWLRALDARLDDSRAALVVVDEVERLQTGIDEGWCAPDFLDFLRAAGDALRRVRFLLLTAYPLARLGEHWIDRLISVTPRLISYLDEPDARELLVRPVPDFPDIYPDGGVDRIVRATGRHPFLLQKVGDELVRRINARPDVRDRKRATNDDITRAFDTVVENGIPFAELWRQRTPPERAALVRIARDGSTAERTPVLRQLLREGYLAEREGRLEFAVPLFRAWVEAHVEDDAASAERLDDG